VGVVVCNNQTVSLGFGAMVILHCGEDNFSQRGEECISKYMLVDL
jgi:hypothetical protein